MIDITAAIYSFIAIGDPVVGTLFIFFGLILIFGSYIFYHKRLRYASPNKIATIADTGSKVDVQ